MGRSKQLARQVHVIIDAFMATWGPKEFQVARLRQQQTARDVGDLARDNNEEPDFRIDDVSEAARNQFGFCFNFLVLLINEVWDP